jgi:hypothetical protein
MDKNCKHSSHRLASQASMVYPSSLRVFQSRVCSFVRLSHDKHRRVQRAEQRRAGHLLVRRASWFIVVRSRFFFVVALVRPALIDSLLWLRRHLGDDAVDAVDDAIGRFDVGRDDLVTGDENVAVGGLVDLDGVAVEGRDFDGEFHGEDVGGGVLAAKGNGKVLETS